MIARLEGTLFEKTPTRIVVDVSGVGYELSVPLSTFATLPDEGKTVSLWVHTHVREDAFVLYGFATTRERDVFHLLLRANRVGPRLAQTILSGIDPAVLCDALGHGDVKVLRGVPGIGPKMAERMIVELRDAASELAGALLRSGLPSRGSSRPDPAEEALSALLNLGYPRSKAERTIEAAVGETGEGASIEEVIRAALRSLSS